MDKTLQDHVWKHCLPKEFKEEVKAHYAGLNTAYQALLGKDSLTNAECDRCNAMRENIALYNMYFGKYNLTSDAEGEPKPAEPKYKVGDKVMLNGHGGFEITAVYLDPYIQEYKYRLGGFKGHFRESDLEPYTEPEESPRQFYRVMGTDEHGRQVVMPIPPQLAGPYDISKERTEPEASTCTETCTEDCSSQCKSQDFDNILKDSFAKERRLNIAAMAMQGLLSNPNNNANLSETVADALNCADTLIAEVEKGNSDGED